MMGNLPAFSFVSGQHLNLLQQELPKLPEKKHAIIQTDLQFRITGWNARFTDLFGNPAAESSKNLFDFFSNRFIQQLKGKMVSSLWQNGWWSGEALFEREEGKIIPLHLTVCKLINDAHKPIGFQLVGHVINDLKIKAAQLEDARFTFDALLNILPDGIILVGADGLVNSCNRRGLEILGLKEKEVIRRKSASKSWKICQLDGTPFPVLSFPSVISRETGAPQRNVIMGIERPGGKRGWISVNAEALIRPGDISPYPVVLTFSDITEFVTNEQELLRINERFRHITRITSDAIWDLDLIRNEIYRSEAFNRLSGYSHEEIGSSLSWWFDKVHPLERERVKSNLEEKLRQKAERWDDEYRFECADQSYKTLRDSGIILYADGLPVRMLGAIRDITIESKLKQQLAIEQEEKVHAMAIATIMAQEEEKSRISRELHDNVNQILMSAKLFIESAIQSPEKSNTQLQKAIEYQLMALQEIRKISRSLSIHGTSNEGLKESILDIIRNLEEWQQISVKFRFDERLENELSAEEKLTVYRVVQEQTNNIIKYAEAKQVAITLSAGLNDLRLQIRDDGKGFDMAQLEKRKGIGIFNMENRAWAHHGRFKIKSEPGQGCTIDMRIPIASLYHSPTITKAPQK
ncbi:MAG: PAS domain S-box protein [Chitinophagaceae bacterium]|nr:PAS domain S-box protein [Chitinophagaceae bacterium]MBP8243146.1 PAS domain S-box protein [Chitinophagaceae bacterium]